jgi:dihydroorotase-like cyclic amidohydrolase
VTDLLLKNVNVVTHDRDEPVAADIAIADGRIERVRTGLPGAARVIDGGGRLVTAKVTDTFVRGHHVLEAAKIAGRPMGRHVRRPA